MNKLFTIISILWLSCSVFAQSNSDKPNVIFILADDLGINALNCYGNTIVESPNIDRLYTEGMHFTNGYSNDPTCAPSRAAIMTGQYAPRTNIYRVVDRYKTAKNAKDMRKHMKYIPPKSNHLYSGNSGLDPNNFNLAKAFKNNGYTTAAFGKWHLGAGTSAMHNMGFDEAIETKNHFDFKSTPKQKDYDSLVYNSDYCTEKGIQFMRKSIDENNPFFLYMPYFLVHKPFQPKPEYVAYFNEKLQGTQYHHDDVIAVLSMIKSLDDSVGDLLKALEEMGVEDNTLIVFTSDNGHYKVKNNNMFALPYKGNKGDVWEGGIRVPYIFKWNDKIQENSKSTLPTIHVDLYPTLVDLLDLEIPKSHVLDGKSLKYTLLSKEQKMKVEPMVWFYTNYSGFNSKTKKFKSKWVNVIQEDGYKLLENVEEGTFKLYNLKKDPLETENVIISESKIAMSLKEELAIWKEKTNLPQPKINPDYEQE